MMANAKPVLNAYKEELFKYQVAVTEVVGAVLALTLVSISALEEAATQRFQLLNGA